MTDRAKLEMAIRAVAGYEPSGHWFPIIEAARAHLATLPKVKMVEMQFWIATDNKTGEIVGAWKSEWTANRMGDGPNTTVHAFTKTIEVPA